MKDYDVVVIGGGPAGMGACLESAKTGAKTLLIERDSRLGGILNQCIHNGFGLHYFKEELTGPEYAYRFKKLVEESNVDVLLNTFVTKVEGKKLTIMNSDGIQVIEPKSIVFSMGCREKTAGNIRLNGTRPVGVMTAGQAQKLVNYCGKLPGKKVVILGSGDIGLIMARRLTFAGAEVLKVLELMNTSSGLPRNIRQCLDDFNIPIYYNTTITEVLGKDRVEGIKFAKVDKNLNPIMESEEFFECDLVILSVGLAPEYDIVNNPVIDSRTGGLVVNEFRECSEGVFACGNVLHVHDLVDNVTAESMTAGRNAGLYAQGKLKRGIEHKISNGEGVRYTVPSTYFESDGELEIYFRIMKKYLSPSIVVMQGDEVVFSKSYIALNPGEMESIKIDKSKLKGDISVLVKERV
ncbi:MAG: NAD(P)/FAD-dependent oxidoreductase [Clostridia bacterium]|nr:NAD(P)/FAD-dependent oxidoreductase [Clostridia bacterium]